MTGIKAKGVPAGKNAANRYLLWVKYPYIKAPNNNVDDNDNVIINSTVIVVLYGTKPNRFEKSIILKIV